MKTVCIIPARGGSKRIPRKNVRRFAGKPLLAWSVEAARESGIFDAVLVSTDDDEIAAIAVEHGAEAPFRRPAGLSHDTAPTLPVADHALTWFEQHRGAVEFACCVYASPFVRAEDLVAGREVLRENPCAEFAITVTTFDYPIFRALRYGAGGRLEMIWPENEMKRSQDLPLAVHDAGLFYFGRRAAFAGRLCAYSAVCHPVVLPRQRVQDLDTPEDWAVAENRFAACHA